MTLGLLLPQTVPEELQNGRGFGYVVAFRPQGAAVWMLTVLASADACRYVFRNESVRPFSPFEVRVGVYNNRGEGPFSATTVVYSAEEGTGPAPFPVSPPSGQTRGAAPRPASRADSDLGERDVRNGVRPPAAVPCVVAAPGDPRSLQAPRAFDGAGLRLRRSEGRALNDPVVGRLKVGSPIGVDGHATRSPHPQREAGP